LAWSAHVHSLTLRRRKLAAAGSQYRNTPMSYEPLSRADWSSRRTKPHDFVIAAAASGFLPLIDTNRNGTISQDECEVIRPISSGSAPRFGKPSRD
jgi:hypothetical protein